MKVIGSVPWTALALVGGAAAVANGAWAWSSQVRYQEAGAGDSETARTLRMRKRFNFGAAALTGAAILIPQLRGAQPLSRGLQAASLAAAGGAALLGVGATVSYLRQDGAYWRDEARRQPTPAQVASQFMDHHDKAGGDRVIDARDSEVGNFDIRSLQHGVGMDAIDEQHLLRWVETFDDAPKNGRLAKGELDRMQEFIATDRITTPRQ